jgi:thioesterase domain-containing protein
VVLGAFGTLELARGSDFVNTGQRVRLRASGKLDQPERVRSASSAARKGTAQPESDLEKKMVAIFAEVLRLSEVGLDDNYFDLGGNSLLALSLFKRIQEVCGIRLAQASLLEAGTPRQLAKAASESFSKGRDACLVLLREGTTDKTVFFVHDGDGETLLYLNLARRLRPEFRVFGIHPQRRGALPMVHTTVEDAARHYVSEMKRVAPQGPYRVGGLCAGGVIAFAVAAVLEASGDQVELLVLGEAAPVHAEKRLTSGERRVGSAKVLLRRGLTGDLLPALRSAARSAWNAGNYETRRLTKLVGWYATSRAIPLLEKSRLDWPQALPAPAVRDIWQFAEAAYLPCKLQRTTPVVVRATRSDGTSGDAPLKDLLVDPTFGWQRVAALPVKTVDVAGGHSSMWQEPHVQDLAKRINELLG